MLYLAVGLVILAHWPGHFNADTITTMVGVRDGLITDQHSPILTWLWRQAHLATGAGMGEILILQTAALATGVYLVLRSALDRAWASVAAVLILLAPAGFGLIALVDRDAWFVSSCLLAVGLGVGALRWSGPARRAAWACAVVAAVIAVAARQNGFVAVAPLMAGLALPAIVTLTRRRTWPRRRRALVAVAIGAMATAAVLTASVAAGDRISQRSQHPEVYTYLYDLGHLSIEHDRRFIPALPKRVQPVQTVAEVKAKWNPITGLPLRMPNANWADAERFFEDPTQTTVHLRSRLPGGSLGPTWKFSLYLSDSAAARLAAAWRRSITERPWTYLSGRAALWRRSIGIGTPPIHAQEGTIPMPVAGYAAPSMPVLSELARGWAGLWVADVTLEGSAVHRVWPYLLVCVLGLALLMPRFDPPVRMVGVLMAAVVGLQVGLFFLAPSIELRFNLLTFYSAMIALAVAISIVTRRATSARPPGATSAPPPGR